MNDHEILVAALRAWNKTQDADWRAAGNLVIDHGRWLRDALFCDRCIGNDDGIVFILWYVVAEMLERRELTGTHSEIAILRWAGLLVGDQLGARSLDRTNREALLGAISAALGMNAKAATSAEAARSYAHGRIDAAPPGVYVHAERFVSAVEALGTHPGDFGTLYNRLIRQIHGVRGLRMIGAEVPQ